MSWIQINDHQLYIAVEVETRMIPTDCWVFEDKIIGFKAPENKIVFVLEK